MPDSDFEQLAILGGRPVRTRPWPKWPRGSQGGQRNLFDALHSGKWAISGVSDRTISYEARFGTAFATHAGRRFGVPCSSGTAALTIALQTLGVGPGTAVVVPAVTWVACASAVLNLGAIPVLCDIDPHTLCVDPANLDEAIGRIENTRAIQMVHMYGSVCDVDGFLQTAKRHSLPVLEDGSQAHGGRWRGQPLGSFGAISAFSLQHSKLLTCGEGGVCVTDDAAKYDLLQQLRADARIYTEQNSRERRAGYEIRVRGDVVGRNLCLSEFQAAVALDALERLDSETAQRALTVEHLAVLLKDIPGIRVTQCPSGVSTRPYYRVAVQLDATVIGDAPIELIAAALARECNTDIRPLDLPLDVNPLYQPKRHPMVCASTAMATALQRASVPLPIAHTAFRTTVTIPHQVFLSSEDDMDDLASAFAKLVRKSERDPDWFARIPAAEREGDLIA